MRKIKIDITQEDIDAGEPGGCFRCPVALALRRAAPDAVYIAVEETRIELTSGVRLFCKPPSKVLKFICDFDGNKPVRPFKAELEFCLTSRQPDELLTDKL